MVLYALHVSQWEQCLHLWALPGTMYTPSTPCILHLQVLVNVEMPFVDVGP